MSEALAKGVFETLLGAIGALGYSYEKGNGLSVSFTADGHDVPMHFGVTLDEEKEIVILTSRLPLTMDQKLKETAALAVCAVNYRLCDGSFDYHIPSGEILFRMTANYRESEIQRELLDYMIRCAMMTVDRYNDKLLMLSRGLMTLDELLAEIGFQ